MIKNIINKLIGNIGLNNEKDRLFWVGNKLRFIPAGKRILDAGAGSGIFKEFCSHLDYVSQDFGEYKGDWVGDGLPEKSFQKHQWDIVSDIIKIPEPNASFDAILCTEVFEHIPDPISAIKEFSRLLRMGGQLIITAPFISGAHMTPFHYFSGFNKYFFKYHLENNGFIIEEITPNGNFFVLLAQELRRLPLMTKTYTQSKFRYLYYIQILLLLLLLKKFNQTDNQSHGFMNFGYFVLAKKK